MRTLTEIGDPLDGVFTLQNMVRKNVVPHGGNWPPLGPPWGPQYLKDGGLCPHGGPHINRWGECDAHGGNQWPPYFATL